MPVTRTTNRPGPTARVTAREYDGATARSREDRVAAEEPLEIRLAWPGAHARRVWVTMRTPGHDFELAAGWLLHEGLAGPGSLHTVAYCTDGQLAPAERFNVVTVTLTDTPREAPGPRADALSGGSSACGVCGKDSIDAALATPRAARWTGPLPPEDVVRRIPGLLGEAQPLFAATGGVHAAALVDEAGDVLVVREDVGRHNAVDKVSGARLLAGHSPAAATLAVTGRAGFELVQKAVAAGVGSLVAVGAPTSLAVSLAERTGLVLYGFTSAERTVRYA